MKHPRSTLNITTETGRRTLAIETGANTPLTELLARHGLPLNTRCGGRGLCRGCEVELRRGRLQSLSNPGDSVAPGKVRACLVSLPGGSDTEIEIPSRALLRHRAEVVSDFRINIPRGLAPLRTDTRFAAAVDIGTTTVALALIDLEADRIRATASDFNAQVRFGEDVLTRIQACATDRTQVIAMQRAVAAETVQPLLEEACRSAGVEPSAVGFLTIAGNTTMLHLLAGVDPSPLGVHPFTATFLEHRVFTPAELGLSFGDDEARVHLLPGAAAYVGADITAGIVATGMLYDTAPSLLVDVGTNGEIVAKLGDRLIGCATAAGPAFEGAGLYSGTRAVRGAISHIRLRSSPLQFELTTIGPERTPIGICGSAYIDFLAEAARIGYLDSGGRFSEKLLNEAGSRILNGKYGKRLVLEERGASGPIQISELDIARLLQAKAAIAAGIQTLLDLLELSPADIPKVYLAGGFGMHLSLHHAIGCGLLPGFRPDQIQVVGNTALAGAMLAATERDLLEEMSRAANQLEEIELNLQPGFEDAYIDNLMLSPEAPASLAP